MNAGRALWAVAGSGGGGGGNTLTSPASITPAGDGTASLSVLSTGPALASVQIGNGNSGQSASLYLENGSPGSSVIQMDSVVISQSAFSGVLTVANINTGLTPFSVDTIGNAVGLGAAGGTVSVNAPLTYSSSAGAPTAGFPPTVLTTPTGTWVAGSNSIVTGGLARGLYTIYGDSAGSIVQADLDARFSSTFQVDPAFTVSGGGGGADTGWNLSPNGTGGLTLTLTNAPTSAFRVKCFPLYLF